MTLFVDTSGLFALIDRHDLHHPVAVGVLEGLAPGRRLVTHSYVVIESLSLTARRLGPSAALSLADRIHDAVDVTWVDKDLHGAGLEAFRRSGGRPSLVDEVSFELMQRLTIHEALAFDKDFQSRGFVLPAVRPKISETPATYSPVADAETFVGVAEIAERIDVRPDTVHKWRTRHPDFPGPVAHLAVGPVWRWEDVRPWVMQRRRRATSERGVGVAR